MVKQLNGTYIEWLAENYTKLYHLLAEFLTAFALLIDGFGLFANRR